MTQEASAPVGGANDTTVVAAEPTLEERFAAFAGDEGEEEKKEEAEDGELTVDDLPQGEEGDGEGAAEAGDDEGGEAAAPISPPSSWTAAEKAEFAQLPRNLQETLTRRETERERFVQQKSQEARAARSAVEREALASVQQLNAQYVQQLQHFDSQFATVEPDPQLLVDDPELYAAQLSQHRYASAQRAHAQQLIAQAQQQAQFAQSEITKREQEETRAALAESFPEYLDPTTGPKLREDLGSTAVALGYSAEQLANVDHLDILAMRTAHGWRIKADKLDALVAKRMETVRAAKGLPRVSKPGVSQGPGVVANQRYAADRQAMRSGDKAAAARVFGRFVT